MRTISVETLETLSLKPKSTLPPFTARTGILSQQNLIVQGDCILSGNVEILGNLIVRGKIFVDELQPLLSIP